MVVFCVKSKLRTTFTKLGLACGLVILCILLGGATFQVLERPTELENNRIFQQFQEKLNSVTDSLANSTASAELKEMFQGFVDGTIKLRPPTDNWKFGQACFFAFTIITTIGYGTYAPQTTIGRGLVILYGICGIAATGFLLSELTGVITICVDYISARCCNGPRCRRILSCGRSKRKKLLKKLSNDTSETTIMRSSGTSGSRGKTSTTTTTEDTTTTDKKKSTNKKSSTKKGKKSSTETSSSDRKSTKKSSRKASKKKHSSTTSSDEEQQETDAGLLTGSSAPLWTASDPNLDPLWTVTDPWGSYKTSSSGTSAKGPTGPLGRKHRAKWSTVTSDSAVNVVDWDNDGYVDGTSTDEEESMQSWRERRLQRHLLGLGSSSAVSGEDGEKKVVEEAKREAVSVWHRFLIVNVLEYIYLSIGAAVYNAFQGWGFFNSFYFCFVSLATIGFGDFAPDVTGAKWFSFFYIFIGLSLVAYHLSLVTELIKKFQEFMVQRAARAARKAAMAITGDMDDEWTRDKKVVELESGVVIAYKEFGDPTKPPLVLLHGYTDTSRSWSLLKPLLEKDFHIFAPDLRGHGMSKVDDDAKFTFNHYSTDLGMFMDAMKLHDAHIAGHSLGSLIAWVFAAHHPGRVRGLVLVATTDSTTKVFKRGGDLWEAITDLDIPPKPDCDFIKEWYKTEKPVDDAFIEAVRTEAIAMPRDVWLNVLEMMADEEFREDLPSAFHVHTLVVWGSKDQLFSREAQGRVRDVLHDEKFVEFKDCGHNLLWESPDVLAEEMRNFLTEEAKEPLTQDSGDNNDASTTSTDAPDGLRSSASLGAADAKTCRVGKLACNLRCGKCM